MEIVAFVEYTPGSGLGLHELMGIVSSPIKTTLMAPPAFCAMVTVSEPNAHGVLASSYVTFHVPQGTHGPTIPLLELLELVELEPLVDVLVVSGPSLHPAKGTSETTKKSGE